MGIKYANRPPQIRDRMDNPKYIKIIIRGDEIIIKKPASKGSGAS